MRAAADTLADLATRKYAARLGVTTVLHTWTREMTYHPHVHAVVSSVGLRRDRSAVVRSKDGWLFARKGLARCFRAKFLGRLGDLAREGLLDLGAWSFATWRQKACRTEFVVHVEPPRGRDTAEVVRYLAAYVNNVAISDRRIVSATPHTVTIAGRSGPVSMPGAEFVRRWSLHVLPKGFRKVRHTGLYAPGNGALLAEAKAKLGDAGFPKRTAGGEPPAEASRAPAEKDWSCLVCGGVAFVTVDLRWVSQIVMILRQASTSATARGPP